MSGVPKELDETAYVDGYSFWRFFAKIFVPTIAAGIGVACFFCFMFSWVELLLAKTLTSVEAKPIAATMTRTASTSGYELGLLAAAGVLTIVPGAFVIYFVRNYIAKGFALGASRRKKMDGTTGLSWMAWTWPTAAFFAFIAGPGRHVGMGMVFARRNPRHGILGLDTTRGDRLFISLLGSAFILLAWLGIIGTPLWGGLVLSLVFALAVFRWV